MTIAIKLIGNTLLGLALFAFFLIFTGALRPVLAAPYYDGTGYSYRDTTPDYVLFVRTDKGVTAMHFEDEQACLNAGKAIVAELGIWGTATPVVVCAAEQSE